MALAHRYDVGTAISSLDGVVGEEPCIARVGSRLVELILELSIRLGNDCERDAPRAKRDPGAVGRQLFDGEARVGACRGGDPGRYRRGTDDRDVNHLGGPIAKGDAEPDGEDDRERERPEECLGLTNELLEPHGGQLDERVGGKAASRASFGITHRGAAGR